MFIHDNRSSFAGLFGLVVLFVYYFTVWLRHGKDPVEGTIIPLYEPPDKFSPASIRFVTNMGFDNKVFSAAIINMAVKGYITIREENNDYTLVKTGADDSTLSRDEKVGCGKTLCLVSEGGKGWHCKSFGIQWRAGRITTFFAEQP